MAEAARLGLILNAKSRQSIVLENGLFYINTPRSMLPNNVDLGVYLLSFDSFIDSLTIIHESIMTDTFRQKCAALRSISPSNKARRHPKIPLHVIRLSPISTHNEMVASLTRRLIIKRASHTRLELVYDHFSDQPTLFEARFRN